MSPKGSCYRLMLGCLFIVLICTSCSSQMKSGIEQSIVDNSSAAQEDSIFEMYTCKSDITVDRTTDYVKCKYTDFGYNNIVEFGEIKFMVNINEKTMDTEIIKEENGKETVLFSINKSAGTIWNFSLIDRTQLKVNLQTNEGPVCVIVNMDPNILPFILENGFDVYWYYGTGLVFSEKDICFFSSGKLIKTVDKYISAFLFNGVLYYSQEANKNDVFVYDFLTQETKKICLSTIKNMTNLLQVSDEYIVFRDTIFPIDNDYEGVQTAAEQIIYFANVSGEIVFQMKGPPYITSNDIALAKDFFVIRIGDSLKKLSYSGEILAEVVFTSNELGMDGNLSLNGSVINCIQGKIYLLVNDLYIVHEDLKVSKISNIEYWDRIGVALKDGYIYKISAFEGKYDRTKFAS